MDTFQKEKIDYTIISNNILRNTKLSWRAKGVYVQLASLPDGWDFSAKGLTALADDSEYATREALKELESNGYLIREQKKENGLFSGYKYTLLTSSPCVDIPSADIRQTDNNNNMSYPKECLNICNMSYSKDKNKISKNKILKNSQENENSEPQVEFIDNTEYMFDRFWNSYPTSKRKVNRKKCLSIFGNIKNLEQEFPRILEGLQAWKNSKEWRKENGEYIPMPQVWLNQERWKSILEVDEQKKQDDEDLNDMFFNR